jgi:hypothetical protein
MAERGTGVRQLARACYVNPSHISNIRNGKDRPSPELAKTIDKFLAAGGRLAALAAPQSRPTRVSRVAEALAVTVGGEHGDGDAAADGLADLVGHYSHVIAVAPSTMVYDEILDARTFAGMLLERGSRDARPGLSVTAGWLSSLLAISATDLGDHTSAIVWCALYRHVTARPRTPQGSGGHDASDHRNRLPADTGRHADELRTNAADPRPCGGRYRGC